MLQHAHLGASSFCGGRMDNTSSDTSFDNHTSLMNSSDLAQQQQFDAACLIHKIPARHDVRELNSSPADGCDLESQEQKGMHKSVLTCSILPNKGSQPGSPTRHRDEDVKESIVSNNTAVLASSCSLDDAGQLDVSCSKSTPAELSYRQQDHDSATNNLLLQQQQSAAAPCANPAMWASGGSEPSTTQQQILQENAEAVDCTDCPGAGTAATAASEVAQQGLPMPSDNEQDACCVFFARVPPKVPYESIMALFQQFGTVKSLNLFRPWASAKTSKGCGIVEYEEAPAALAAMQALHTKYHWTGGDTTMVVEWMDLARHRKDKQAQEEDGRGSRSNGSARKASKSARKKSNGKNTCLSMGNFNNMPLSMPNIGLGGRLMPLVAGLAGNMCPMPYSAQQQYSTPWVMGMAAGDLALRQAAALAGMTGGLMDPAASVGLLGSTMPLLPAYGLEQGAGVLPVMYGATTSTEGGNSSWAVNKLPEPIASNTHAVAQAAAERAAVATLLLQQQRQVALASMPAAPAAVQRYSSLSADGSIGAFRSANTASQPDLQQMLDNLSTQNYLAGLSGVDASTGSMSGTPPLHGLNAAGGINTAGGYSSMQAAAGTGSPAANSGNLFFDSCQYSAPAMATAVAAASIAGTNNSVAGAYGCPSAPLPRIATRSSDGCGSGVFSMCGQDLSPMTANNTPTYFQQGYGNVSSSGHPLLGLNAASMAQAAYGSPSLMGSASGTPTTAAALQDQLAGAAAAGMMAAAQRVASQSRLATAVRRNSSGLAPYMIPNMTSEVPAHGSKGNLLTAENRWRSM